MVGIWGQTRNLDDRNQIWGQTLSICDRTIDPAGPDQAPVGRSQPALAPRDGDRHDVRHTDQERSTSNVQLSTFNEVTERAHGGAGYGDRHGIWATEPFGPVDLTKRPSGGPRRLARRDMGTGTMSGTKYGDRHDVGYTDQERSTSNVQLSTFNEVTERAHGGRDMGTDTQFKQPDS